ncbi:MAG: dienelactone hydrolase family protein [Solirubrobacteraceae bacterium]
MVVFAHGSGSGRFSPRNRAVADALGRSGLATLLIDLLTRQEEAVDLRTRHLRFDIALLARRVIASIDWLASEPAAKELPIGCFGASTGAAAALLAAAERPRRVGAVVSRGGRPDLLGEALGHVRAPTLLIVGGNDPEVLRLNQRALAALDGDARLEVVPGARARRGGGTGLVPATPRATTRTRPRDVGDARCCDFLASRQSVHGGCCGCSLASRESLCRAALLVRTRRWLARRRPACEPAFRP